MWCVLVRNEKSVKKRSSPLVVLVLRGPVVVPADIQGDNLNTCNENKE
jgi:hypothetical protein